MDLLILNASQLLTIKGSDEPHAGKEMTDLGIIKNGAMFVSNGAIEAVGTTKELRSQGYTPSRADEIIDAENQTVMPGFVDPHTHLVWDGPRANEIEMKLSGLNYLQIAEKGGGILKTVNQTRKASTDELVSLAEERLKMMIQHGTTTLEAKSGYGLDTESELRSLQAIQILDQKSLIDIIPTFLGAHSFPPEFKDDHEGYVDLIINEMIPKIAEFARYCDVFIEKNYFTVDQGRRIFEAAGKFGMRPRVHAEEIMRTGGSLLAAELRAASADHLVKATVKDIKALIDNRVIPTLLPGTPYSLMDKYPNARRMIDMGAPVAIATDFNPNCMAYSMQFIISLAVYNMKMLPAEAIIAATINPAFALDMQHIVGSLEEGKKADIIIIDAPSYHYIPYRFGINQVCTTIKEGNILYSSDLAQAKLK